MKYRSLIILSLLLLTYVSCKKLDKLTQFDMDYDSSITIKSTVGINLPFNIYTPDITTNSESTFKSNDTRKDLIEKIVLKTLQMTIKTPSDGDFSFLKSIEIKIAADGLSDKKIAWNYDIPNNVGNKISLQTSGDDLKEYIMKDSYKLKVTTTTDKILTQDHTIDIHSVFFVDAKILGL